MNMAFSNFQAKQLAKAFKLAKNIGSVLPLLAPCSGIPGWLVLPIIHVPACFNDN